jgi:hypothetical protein
MDNDISQFLIASAALCQAAWTLHGADGQQFLAGKYDLANTHTNLRRTIRSLLNRTAANTDETAALFHACCKVGRDLAVRLDRAENLVHDPRGVSVQESQLRDVWAQHVIEALVTRLIDLIRQYQAVNPKSQ